MKADKPRAFTTAQGRSSYRRNFPAKLLFAIDHSRDHVTMHTGRGSGEERSSLATDPQSRGSITHGG